MTTRTLDLESDEMLLMTLLLGQFIDNQLAKQRDATTDEDAEQARWRLEIAYRLRGKLPLVIEWSEALSVQRADEP